MFSIKAVFIDRDGVINEDLGRGVASALEFHIIQGSVDAIRMFNQARIKVILITNQALVGRGVITENDLNDIHEHMLQLLKEGGAFIDDIYVCTSDDSEHPDRKPNPGMLLKALQEHSLSAQEVVFIGDDVRDLIAAKRAGVKSILVRTGKGDKTAEQLLIQGLEPVMIADDLMGVAKALLRKAVGG